MPRSKLTVKQEKFINAYLYLGNATQAAIQAGYSPKSAHSTATEILQYPAVIERKAELLAKTAPAEEMSLEERRVRLSEIAKAEFREPITAKESILAIAELNKLHGDYAPEKHAILGKVIFEVVHIDRKEIG